MFWGGWAYIYIHTTHGWFEMPISFFWEWQAVGARCFISFDHHTQKREGGVVSAFFFNFWHFIFAKDTTPCSFQNQTLLLLEQKQPLCILNSSPNVLHRYIVSAKTSMNNKYTQQNKQVQMPFQRVQHCFKNVQTLHLYRSFPQHMQ